MATQDEHGIDFSLLPDGRRQHFRLLELPAELLDVITRDVAQTLHLKSPEGTPDDSSSQNIVLCTADKTYSIRQVSTSNSLFVVQPSTPSGDDMSTPSVEAIAQCTSTLEVHLETKTSAVPYIQALVPVFTSSGNRGTGKAISKQQLFSQVPLSDSECEQGWKDLACFESDREALQPSNSVKLEAWRTILTTAVAEEVNIASTPPAVLIQLMAESDIEWPVDLYTAIIRSISSDENSVEIAGNKLAAFVGLVLLKERTKDGQVSVSSTEFHRAWKDLLPEAWRDRSESGLLDENIRREKGSASISYDAGRETDSAATSTGAQADARSSIGAKRKWHEKFRASKKA